MSAVLRWGSMLALGLAVCGCSRPPPPPGAGPRTGHRNEPCRASLFDANPCDGGLVCDDDVCRDCGDAGERCCRLFTCNGGNECRSNGGVRTCGDCGEIGEACCPSDLGSSCADGVRCNTTTNTCEAPFTDPCTGSTPRLFWGRRADGCATSGTVAASVSVDDLSTAQQCARGILGVADVREEAPELHDTCERQPFGFCEEQQRWAFSESDARQCAQAVCGAGCSVVIGDCPADGSGICM